MITLFGDRLPDGSVSPGDPRTTALAGGLQRVRQRLAAACAAAGRSVDDVTLIAVTKNHSAQDVVRLAHLGVTQMGENRDQEAVAKVAAVAEAGATVVWHFVGRLQRNKCRSVVRYADVVHSADSLTLVSSLDRAALQYRDAPLDTLVQVSLDGDQGRGGAVPDGGDPQTALEPVAAAVAAAEGLRLRGLMAVAPLAWGAQEAFEQLALVAERFRGDHPEATWLSAGMSGDLEQAVAGGSTHVRVGSALLGKRAVLR